jgi:hypothetical protein
VHELSLVLNQVISRIRRILALQAEIEIVVIGVVSASTTVLGQSTELEYGGIPAKVNECILDRCTMLDIIIGSTYILPANAECLLFSSPEP